MKIDFTLFYLLLACLAFWAHQAPAQVLPISIDSQFDDWTGEEVVWEDAVGDGTNIDFLRFSVANDEQYLFLKLETEEEINLTDNNKITLYIDSDNNQATGTFFNGIGADLTVHIGEKEAYYELSSSSGWYSLNELTFRHQPTVTSGNFEIAISRETVSSNGSPLFPGNEVKLAWRDAAGSNGDRMPDNGATFGYVFDNSPAPPTPLIQLEKSQPAHLRLLTWNTLNNGLDDIGRASYFDRVLNVLQPDIVTFNECWDIEAPQVATFMNGAVPIGNFQSWKAVKLDQGNITASRFPILQNWLIFPGHRLTASLIDLPDEQYEKDLLVINAHFKCCGDGNFDRQREADAFINFILDAKSPGGVIDLPEDTPFVLSGDLNLVGSRQQLTTLLTGEIINTGQFGPGGSPDWDNSELLDVIGRQTDQRMAFTWENYFSDFPPSRIDYHILSNSVINIEKNYTLNTRVMSAGRLDEYGLEMFDTDIASDHLPKVTDLTLAGTTALRSVRKDQISLAAAPNPAADFTEITVNTEEPEKLIFLLQNAAGQEVKNWSSEFPAVEQKIRLEWKELPAGIYFLMVRAGDHTGRLKLIRTGQ